MPISDSTITGTFIHPWAISRMPPMPEVNTLTLVISPIMMRFSGDVTSDAGNGRFSAWNISTFTAYRVANPRMMTAAIRTARPGCVPYPHPRSRNSQSANRRTFVHGRTQVASFARRWFTLNR